MALKSNEILQDKVISNAVVEVLEENLMWRQAFRNLPGENIGSNKQTITVMKDTMGKPEPIAELEEFPFDEGDYEEIDMIYQKYGKVVPISWEAMEDGRVDVVRIR